MRKLKIKYALALALTGFSAVGVASGVKVNGKGGGGKEIIKYVSLGDSMSTGFGFDDYYLGKYDGSRLVYDESMTYSVAKSKGLIAEEDGFRNVRGFLNNMAEKSYPYLIKQALTDSSHEVELTQLATNAARVDDLYFQLAGKPGDTFYKNCFAAYGGHEEWNKVFAYKAYEDELEPALTEFAEKSNNYDIIDYDKIVHEVYVDAVKKANLITLSAGFNNFGCFITGRINEIIKGLPIGYSFGGDDKLQDLLDTIGVDIDTEDIYKEIFDLLKSSIPFEMSDEGVINLGLEIDLKYLIDRVAYATVSYCYYMNELTKLIRELNPTAELVVIGMEGAIKGITLELGGITIDIEDFYNKLFKFANLFAAVGTEVADTYKFVDLENVNVGLHVSDMAAGTMDESQINRAMMAIQTLCNQFGLKQIDGETNLVPTFASIKSQINGKVNENLGGINPFLNGTFNIDNYLTADFGHAPSDAEVYINKWLIDKADIVSNYQNPEAIRPYADSIGENVSTSVNEGLNLYYGGLDTFLGVFQRAVGSAEITPEALSAFGGGDMTEAFTGGALDGLLNLYIRAILNNGMWNHPNAEGHRAISEAVIAGIESNVTAREYGLAQVYALLEELTGLPVQQIVETLMAKKEEAAVLFEKTGELVSLYSGEILDVIKSAIEKVAPVVVEEAKGLADFSFARLSELKDSVMAKLAEGVDLAKVKVNEAVEEIKEVIAKEVAGLKAILELTVKAMEITLKAQAKKAIEFGEAKLAETYNAVLVKLVEIKDNLVETSQAIGEAAVRALKAAGEDIKEYLIGLLHSSEYEALKAKLMSDIKGEFDAFVLEAKKLGEELFVKFNNAATEFGEFVKDSVKLIAQNTVEGIKAVGNEVLSMHINLVNIAKAVEAFVSGAEAYLINLYNGGLEQLHTTVNEILEAVQGGITYCYDKVNGAVELAQSVKDMVQEYVEKITEAAKAKYENALEKSELLRSIVEEFVEKVQTLFGEAELTIAEINAAIEAIKSQISSMADDAALEAHKVIDSLIVARDAIKEAMEKAKEVVVKVEQSLEEATKLIQEAVSKVAAAAEKAMVLAEEAAAKLVAVFNEVKGAVIAVAIATSAAITTVITVINAVNAEIAEKLPGVAAVLNSVVNGIVNFAEATCEFLVETTRKIAKVTGEVIEVAEKAIKAFCELKAMIGEAIDTTKAMIEYISIEAEKIMVKVQEVMDVVKHIYNVIDETFPGFLDKVNEVVSTAVQKEIDVNVKFLNEQINKLGDETVEKINAELVVIDGKFVALEERLEEIVANALVEALEVITDGAVKASIEAKETAGEIVYLVSVAAIESVVDVNVAVIEGIVDVFKTIIDELTTAPEINFIMNQADVVAAKEGLKETVESSVEEIVQADKNAQNNMTDALYRLLQSLNLAD